MSKRKIVAITTVSAFVVFVIGTFVGGKIVESNTNVLINQGMVFATPGSLNKYVQESQNLNKEVEVSTDEWSQSGQGSVEEYRNEIAGIQQIVREIINPLIKEKVSNAQLYQKVNNKEGDEFLSNDFAEMWVNEYKVEHAQAVVETKKLRERIMSGEIFSQNIFGKKVYYAPNYFNWTKEKINSLVWNFCDGLGCNVPTIISVDKGRIFWTNQQPCIGGARSDETISKEEFYSQYQCKFLNEAIVQ